VLAATLASAFMVAGPAHATSTFNSINNGGNGKCLDVRSEDGYYNLGSRVQQYHCTGAQEQQWRLVPEYSNNGETTTYEIISQRSGLCLARTAVAVNGSQVYQEPCGGATTVWYFAGNENGYALENTFDYRCLDVSGNSSADYAKIQMWTCNGTTAQLWRSNSFFPAGNVPPVN
jgi:hypothetical protein